MRNRFLPRGLAAAAIVAALLGPAGCAREPMLRAADLSTRLGQQVTVEGWAVNAKLGELLRADGVEVWLDGVDAWPAGYYSGGDRGRHVRVHGILWEQADLPVFVPRPGEPIPQGIPVENDAQLAAASRRYVLKNPRF